MSSDLRRDRLAIDLKKWLRSQTRYKTVRDVANAAGIPYSTLKKYFFGKRIPSGPRLDSLAGITGLPSLLVLSQQQKGLPKELPPLQSPSVGTTADQAAREILITMHRLMNELNYFKRSSVEDRALLRRVVPARDVGYVTSLLKAMYDEDQFQAWVYFVDYNPESR